MPKKIVYEIHLIDDVSEKAKAAERHVSKLETGLKGLGKAANEAGKSLGKMFEIPSAGEFLKQSVDTYGGMERSLALIQNTLKNTGNAAGLSLDELKSGAERFAASTIYSKNQVLEMQAKLVQFPRITKDVFSEAENAVMDLATQSDKSLQEVSESVGKALSDPSAIDDMLEEYGIAFDKKQKRLIERLTKSGRLKEAQQAILKGISDKVGGSTQAVSSTLSGQAEIMNHKADEAREGWGKEALEQLIMEKPAIDKLIDASKDLTNWMDKDKESIHDVVDVLAPLGLGIMALGKVAGGVSTVLQGFKFVKGLFGGGEAAAGATDGAAALDAAELGGTGAIEGAGALSATEVGAEAGALAIPVIGEVVAGILVTTVVVAGAYALFKALKAKEGGTKDKKEAAKPFAGYDTPPDNPLIGHFKNDSTVYKVVPKFKNNDPYTGIVTGQDTLYNVKRVFVKDPQPSNSTWDNLPQSTRDYFEKAAQNTEKAQKQIDNKIAKDKEKADHKADKKTTQVLSQMQSSVTGQNIKNYNIKIGTLGQISMNVKTLVESKTDIKRAVTDWLMDALHDSELGG